MSGTPSATSHTAKTAPSLRTTPVEVIDVDMVTADDPEVLAATAADAAEVLMSQRDSRACSPNTAYAEAIRSTAQRVDEQGATVQSLSKRQEVLGAQCASAFDNFHERLGRRKEEAAEAKKIAVNVRDVLAKHATAIKHLNDTVATIRDWASKEEVVEPP